VEASAPSERRHRQGALDGVLFERDAALAVLAAALDGTAAGRGSVAAIEGPPGSGKSAVLDAIGGLARERGVEVLAAQGRERERELELGVALQLLERRVTRASGAERERLLAGPAEGALALFESGPPAGGAEAAGALVHSLYRLCLNLAGTGPLALVVDDVDVADAATLRFLLYLAGRVEAMPLALVVSAGSAVRPADDDLLAELLAHPAARGCTLDPLTPAATTGWLRASFFPDAEEGFCAAVHRATGGTPWLVGELGRELAATGAAPTAQAVGEVGAAAPPPVADAVLRRARMLDDEAPSLLEAAAVLGPGAELRHAAALAGIERSRAAALADALAATGVLSGGVRLTFAHPVVERAIHAGLPAAERAEAHLEAARALRDDDAPAGEVAAHLLRAQRGGGAWETSALRAAAATELAAGAPERAVELLDRAYREPPPRAQRAPVLLELGRAEAVAGLPGALGRLTDAIERLPAADERAATALAAGRTLVSLGRLSDAAAALGLGVRYAADGDGDLAGRLKAAHATVARLERGRAGRPVAKEKDAGAGDTPNSRALLAQLALDAALRGRPHDRVRELAVKALARGALLDDEGAEGIAYYLATAALTLAEDLQMAEAALAAAVDDARTRGSALGFATASHFQSFAIMRRGRVPAAAAAARAALEGERYGWRLALPSAHAVLAGALIEAGDLEGAGEEVALAAERAEADAPSRLAHLAARGQLGLASRRPQEALSDFLACGELLTAAEAANPAVLPWRSSAALALAAGGDLGEARRLVEEELSLAERFGAPGAIGRALRTLGGLERAKRALEPLEAAVACLEGSQAALERARALVDLGSALRRSHRPRDAREPLRRGLDLAQRCGAGELTARAMRELTAAGARPRRTALHGLEALTPRELQTAGLAAEGMSNRDIADALYVTVKTVEWHLKHAYGKLGISSRRELGRALARPYPKGDGASD
jgi:DNA-binding CsgD family transcriptional regulator